MGTDIIVDPETTAEVLRNIAEKMQKDSEEPGDLKDSAIVQQAAGVIEHLIPCRLCKHYQYGLCMAGHNPADDGFFCKDSKREYTEKLNWKPKGD